MHAKAGIEAAWVKAYRYSVPVDKRDNYVTKFKQGVKLTDIISQQP